jgi:hypothetical protein
MSNVFLRLLRAAEVDIPLGKQDYHVAALKHLIIKRQGRERDYFFDQILDWAEPLENLYNLLFFNYNSSAGEHAILSLFVADALAETKGSTFGDDNDIGVIPLFLRDALMKKDSLDKNIAIELSAVEEVKGDFFDLLANSGCPLALHPRTLAPLGRTWARVHDQADAALLLKLILFNNNSRDFKSSVFEYAVKDPSNLCVSVRVTNTLTGHRVVHHFAEFVTGMQY